MPLKMKRLTWAFIALMVMSPTTFAQKKEVAKVKTVVIDPGHGGEKPGALGDKIQEKDLVLSVALKFGKLIADNYPDVNIIYTRTTDVDVDLSERAHIANRANADLFVSVHANSHPTSKPTGVETFVMGLSQSKSNMEVAKTENADILLESDYEENADYKGFDPNSPESYVQFAMFQNAFIDRSLNFAGYIQKEYAKNIKTVNRGVKQAELFVLYKTTCPAVLTEIGFISNADEEAYMVSDIGQGTLAECMFRAFVQYKSEIEGVKPPAKLLIDLPGYGKNAPSKAELAARAKAEADSLAIVEAERREQFVADSLAAIERAAQEAAMVAQQVADSIAQAEAAAKFRNHVIGGVAFHTATEAPTDKVTYRVQFLSNPKKIPAGDKQFKGIEDYDMYEMDGTYRYTLGAEATTQDALKVQHEVRKKGFEDAFVIAFYQGKRISIQQAREMED